MPDDQSPHRGRIGWPKGVPRGKPPGRPYEVGNHANKRGANQYGVKERFVPVDAAEEEVGGYRASYVGTVEKLIKLGATDIEVSDILGIGTATLRRWQIRYPKFGEAMMRTKEEVDASVERSLYRRATGYTHKATKIMQNNGEPVIVPYEERFPPDAASMFYWLKNRQSKRWRDRIEHVHEGNIEISWLSSGQEALPGDGAKVIEAEPAKDED